jgi:hypothetical protein
MPRPSRAKRAAANQGVGTEGSIDTPNVVKIRNKVGKAFGFWTGNYAVTVMSTMFSWGILYGHLTVNTAKGVPDLERPEELEAQHRMMAHESDASSMVYEQGGNRSRQADKATRALNRKHRPKQR